MFKKILLGLIILFFLSIYATSPAQADENFDIAAYISLAARDTGSTRVTQDIKITNKSEYYYTPSYELSVGSGDIKNIKVFDASGSIPFTLKENDKREKSIAVNFQKRIVGVGKVNSFTIQFDTENIVKKTGLVWEVNVPGLENPESFSSYTVVLQVPSSFGTATVIKPYKSFTNPAQGYTFSKEELGKSGVLLIFGNEQGYQFNLVYHLANSNLFPIKTEIALPPDTAYQTVSVSSITPEPVNVYKDKDGNWLAVYQLAPQSKVNIRARGLVKVFSKPQKTDENVLPAYTQKDVYWEQDDEIKKLGRKLSTPENIYTYVVNKLTYSYTKVTNKNTRLGAKEALQRPTFAVCLEFTDLFIALARAAGIPSRAVEGYAYTDNSKLRPLSLVNDVLHSWPEYYDKDKKQWIMVDPTWGNTTHGLDYFNTLDFSHIAFVINGANSSYPVPAGGYKLTSNTKDVEVSFSDLSTFQTVTSSQILPQFPSVALSAFPIQGFVKIINKGHTALRNKSFKIESDLQYIQKEFTVDEIPPFGYQMFPVVFAKTPLLTSKNYNVTIQYETTTLTNKIFVSVLPAYAWYIIGGGILVTIILLIIALKFRRVSF